MMKTTRRKLFGMLTGLLGIPPAVSIFEDPSFDMAAHLKAEWHKKLYTSLRRDVDIIILGNPKVQKPLGVIDMEEE